MNNSRKSYIKECKQKVRHWPNTNWMYFYIYYRFPIGFIIFPFQLLISIAKFPFDGSSTAVALFFVALLIDLGLFLFSIYTYANLSCLTYRGYQINNIFLITAAVLSIALNFYSALFQIPFVLLNILYFSKRKHLFYEHTLESEPNHTPQKNSHTENARSFNTPSFAKLQSKRVLIAIISCASALALMCTIFAVSYKTAPKRSENILASHLSKSYTYSSSSYKAEHFLYFGKLYNTISFKKFGFVVELNGTVNVTNEYKTIKESISAKVYIPLIGKGEIKRIDINSEKVYPEK